MKKCFGDSFPPTLLRDVSATLCRRNVQRHVCRRNLCRRNVLFPFLRKPHKGGYKIANNYRSLRLISYVGKLFERMIERQFRNDSETKGLINDSQ